MSLTIEQEASYVGEGRWKWAVWIDGPAELLDRIDSVAWHLHPTFPNPLRWADDRADKFRLEAFGWGMFEIRATLYDEAGRPAGPLRRMLRLERPGGDAAPMRAPAKPTRTVFLSASLGDAEISHRLRRALEANGVAVLGAESELQPGQEWREAITQSIRGADAVVAIVRDGVLSPFVEAEVREAETMGKRLVPLIVGAGSLPASLAHRAALQVEDLEDITAAASAIISLLG